MNLDVRWLGGKVVRALFHNVMKYMIFNVLMQDAVQQMSTIVNLLLILNHIFKVFLKMNKKF